MLLLLVVGAAIPNITLAAAPQLDIRANLTPVGCATNLSGTTATVTGCSARAAYVGTSRGRMELAYQARVDLGQGRGAQQGRLTLRGATDRDVLVARFSGRVTVGTGVSRGSWSALSRSGAFTKSAPRSGTYVSRTPDQGVHITFNVRG